jgi:hypothetical protein
MSQLFKTEIDNDLLFKYLNLVCEKTEKYYIYDICSYKKGELNGENKNFCNSILPYYHKAKQKYITRELNYTKFVTIIRQICKQNMISFTTKIIYSKSKYNIPYYIYY